MASLPPKLLDCPRCGDVNRVSGWDGRVDWRCQNCGLVLLRAASAGEDPRAVQPVTEIPPPPEPPPPPSDIRGKLKPWIDIHRLPAPDELEFGDSKAPGKSGDTRPVIPPTQQVRPDAGTAGRSVPSLPLAGKALPPLEREEETLTREVKAVEPPPNTVFPPKPEEPDTTLGSESESWHAEEKEEWESDEEMGEEDFAVGEGTNAPTRRRRKRTILKAKGWRERRLPQWVVYMVAPIAITLVLGAVGWMAYSAMNSQNRMSGVKSAAPEEVQENWKDKAPVLARRFADASTAEDWLPMVRDAERVAPMVHSFAPEVATGRPIKVASHGSEGLGEDEILQYLVTYEDGRSRLIHILSTAEGPKVDWEAFARSGTSAYEDLISATNSLEAELRVLVAKGNYYNFDFADDQAWGAFELTNGDWPEAFTGYAKKGSAVEARLQDITSVSGPPRRVTLKVRVASGQGAHRQCEILEVVVESWVKP